MHFSVLEEQFPRYFHWTWWELCTGYWESKSQLATYEEMPPAVSPWVVFTLLWLTPRVVSKYTLWVWSGSGSISPTTGLVVSCVSEPQSSPMWGYIPQLSTPLRISPPELKGSSTRWKILQPAGKELRQQQWLKFHLVFFSFTDALWRTERDLRLLVHTHMTASF